MILVPGSAPSASPGRGEVCVAVTLDWTPARYIPCRPCRGRPPQSSRRRSRTTSAYARGPGSITCGLRTATRTAPTPGTPERVGRNALRHLLEIRDVCRSQPSAGPSRTAPVVDHGSLWRLAAPPHRQVDLDRLRQRRLVRQDTDPGVKSHALQRDRLAGAHPRERKGAQRLFNFARRCRRRCGGASPSQRQRVVVIRRVRSPR